MLVSKWETPYAILGRLMRSFTVGGFSYLFTPVLFVTLDGKTVSPPLGAPGWMRGGHFGPKIVVY